MDSKEDDLTDFGSHTIGSDTSEDVSLVQDLERELGAVVQHHRIPPDDLQQLFEVVQRMFNLMDNQREGYEKMLTERDELNERWKIEKDNLKKTQKHKLELESQLEEEKIKIELEKNDLEKKNAFLETKIKHLGEQKQYLEQELQQLKDKATRDEKTRQDLIEQYKKQIESVSTQQSRVVLHRMQSPLIPRQPIIDLLKKRQFSASLGASVSNLQPLEYSTESDVFMIGSMEVPREEPHREEQDELEVKEAEKLQQQRLSSPPPPPPSSLSLDDEFRELEQQKEREEEERLRQEEELRLQEEMMAEVEMMQKEKESWEEEKKNLERERVDAITQRESLEQYNAELQVEMKRMRELQEDLKERLSKVIKERDEVYDNYLKQPLSAYNISRKELHNLLMKQQATASELDSQRDQTLKYMKLYDDSRRSYYDRLKERMWKLFSKQPASSTDTVRYTAREASTSSSLGPSLTTITPLCHSIAVVMGDGKLMVDKGWLMSSMTSLPVDNLPQWMGQVPLKSVMIERIESVELGRIYYSHPEEQRAEVQLQAGLHAEVWVTTKEKSMSVACVNIEVIDILSMPPRVCQRFILKPETPHIVCMRSIPGIIEEASTDWVSSDLYSSASASQQKQLVADGASSKIGSLEKGKTALVSTVDLGLPDLEPTHSATKPELTDSFAKEEEEDVGKHKHLTQLVPPQPEKPMQEPEESVHEDYIEATSSQSSDRPNIRKLTDGKTPIMWIVTENNMLCFYPTTDPRHRPLNSIKLESRATCMEYFHDKVFIGHEASTISIYSKNESTACWDLETPHVITLPSHNPEVQNDVRCIAAVKDRVWVGAGPSIFFLSIGNLECEGSRFLNMEHFLPDQILPLGDVVAVSTKSSSVFIFDAESTNFVKTFDVYPMTRNLITVEQNSKWKEVRSPLLEKIPTIIKTMVADETMLYVGTSQGMVVAAPIASLSKDSSSETTARPKIKKDLEEEMNVADSGSAKTHEKPIDECLNNCALALHVQKDSRVKSLLYLQLPLQPPPDDSSLSKEMVSLSASKPPVALQESSLNNSSFNEDSNSGSLSLKNYRSLIISAGKGHMEYSESPDVEDTLQLPPDYNSLREKNEEHQLLMWGHKL